MSTTSVFFIGESTTSTAPSPSQTPTRTTLQTSPSTSRLSSASTTRRQTKTSSTTRRYTTPTRSTTLFPFSYPRYTPKPTNLSGVVTPGLSNDQALAAGIGSSFGAIFLLVLLLCCLQGRAERRRAREEATGEVTAVTLPGTGTGTGTGRGWVGAEAIAELEGGRLGESVEILHEDGTVERVRADGRVEMVLIGEGGEERLLPLGRVTLGEAGEGIATAGATSGSAGAVEDRTARERALERELAVLRGQREMRESGPVEMEADRPAEMEDDGVPPPAYSPR